MTSHKTLLAPVVKHAAVLPDLAYQGMTHKQLAYCEARVGGLSATEAYRVAYNPADPKAPRVGVLAYEVETGPKVQAKLRELLAERGSSTSLSTPITKDIVLNGIAAMAMGTNDKPAVQLRAWELLGKAVGLFDKDSDDTANQRKPQSASDVDAEIKRRLASILGPTIDMQANPQPAPAADVEQRRRERRRKPA